MKQNPHGAVFKIPSISLVLHLLSRNVDINKETPQHCENTSYIDFSVCYPFRATSLETSTLCAGRQEISLCLVFSFF